MGRGPQSSWLESRVVRVRVEVRARVRVGVRVRLRVRVRVRVRYGRLEEEIAEPIEGFVGDGVGEFTRGE